MWVSSIVSLFEYYKIFIWTEDDPFSVKNTHFAYFQTKNTSYNYEFNKLNKVNRQRIAGRLINMHIAALLVREDKGNPWNVRKFDPKVQEKAKSKKKVKKRL